METNLMDFEKELDNFLSGPEYEQKPVVSVPEDEGKTITTHRFADTKYGRKLVLEVRFEDGTEKVVFLSKSWAKEFVKFAGKPPWVGKRVRIEGLMVMNPSKKEMVKKPFPNPIIGEL